MLSELPESLRRECTKCGRPVALVRTPRKSKGQPVEVLVDFAPDTGEGGTVPVELKGGILYGDSVPAGMAAGMRKHGVPLRALHAQSCIKHNATRKRS